MRCPFCGNVDTQVKDSRPAEDHVSIRRRRFCPACGGRFTTYERVQLRDLIDRPDRRPVHIGELAEDIAEPWGMAQVTGSLCAPTGEWAEGPGRLYRQVRRLSGARPLDD